MNHDIFYRSLTRCQEVAAEPGAPDSVKQVYEHVLKAPAEAYISASDALVKAESGWRKESFEALRAIEGIDQPYRIARSVLAANIPTALLPDTLKAARTDTDKVLAVESLQDLADQHKDEAWGKAVNESEFGKLAPAVIKEVNEAITASKEVGSARDTRAKTYGLAYDKYLAFKRVVRDVYGSNSKQYQRIHVRARETDPTPPAPPVTPTP